ncbi:MAG: bifunctional diaminohydroxyphosphoribosylaminopyrimidine deaminase/5-amino-6-(5-phosphoribosylamino)uracil reductase RibD [Candidatus Gracilibacteria bacterium]
MKNASNAFMARAAELAWQGKGKVEPNPMVGAIFVKNKKIIAEGWHQKFGGPHAEINAIQAAKKAKKSLKGATLYVTLEPCCHYGKQPPCTEALKSLNLKKIIFATLDPNPLVRGKGIKILKKAGIITEKMETHETRDLNAIYLTNTLKKRPFIHLKTVCTQDGKITLQKGKSTTLTGKESQKKIHELRARYNGILIGVNTLLIDNPRLTVRSVKSTKNPTRIILDSHLRTPFSSQIFKEKGHTILATTTPLPSGKKLQPRTTLLVCKKTKTGKIDLHDLLKKLFALNIRSVLIEGGEQVNTSFLKEKLVDRVTFIFTPHRANNASLPSLFDRKILPKIHFNNPSFIKIGKDLWVEMS